MRSPHRRPLACVLSLAIAFTVCAACAKKESGTQTSSGSIGATAATTSPLRVAHVMLGRGVGPDKQVTSETTEFGARDTIYASVHTTGAANGAKLTARWTFQDGQQVDEHTETISPTGDAYTEFHVAKPSGWPAGRYTVRILLNGQETASQEFSVRR